MLFLFVVLQGCSTLFMALPLHSPRGLQYISNISFTRPAPTIANEHVKKHRKNKTCVTNTFHEIRGRIPRKTWHDCNLCLSWNDVEIAWKRKETWYTSSFHVLSEFQKVIEQHRNPWRSMLTPFCMRKHTKCHGAEKHRNSIENNCFPKICTFNW